MVKEFQVVLTPPPQGIYSLSSDVIGHVFLVTDATKRGYKSITVTLKGYADVKWTEKHGKRTVTYHSHKNYIDQTLVVWNRESAPDHQLAPGSYQFPFALKMRSRRAIPPHPFEGSFGRIRYEVEATIVKAAALKINKRFAVQIPYTPVVDPNADPNLKVPKILQKEKTLCCLCCVSGPISLTARVSRTGFCIGQGAIPFEADIENGSNRRIGYLQAQLQRKVMYTVQGRHRYDVKTLAKVSSDPIEPGNSLSWRPPPLPVPATEPTITNCSIIQVLYYLKIQASISGAINPHVDFLVFLGNVPLGGIEGATVTQPLPSAPVPAAYGPPRSAFTGPPPSGFTGPPPSTGLPPGFIDPIKH